jgi:hypothetical protein
MTVIRTTRKLNANKNIFFIKFDLIKKLILEQIMNFKNLLNLVLTSLCIFTLISFYSVAAKQSENNQIAVLLQDTSKNDEEVPEELKYYKERYEVKYKEPFDVVWKAVKMSISDLKCPLLQETENQNEKGFYQGVIKSDNCLLAQGKDSSEEVMDRYSYDRPRIMAGVWKNCRVQYRFVIREQEDGTTSMLLKTDMSGFEEYVTYEVQFWKSNGILEHNILLDIDKKIAVVKTQK